jgi:peptide-methionine (S)-S-oxide reductase
MADDISETPSGRREVATLGGGCFWCTEAVFTILRGVVTVEAGYAGGWLARPTYEQVATGSTGHAEVVHITFDPTRLAYRDLLTVFFATHDPTTTNRQGADVGPQYRSVIFYHTAAQHATAEALIRELTAAGNWRTPIVTPVEPFTTFFPADAYHQHFFERHPRHPYCQLVIAPKMTKLRQKYAEKGTP